MNEKKPVEREALTEAEAAELLGLSRSFLRQCRMNGDRTGRMPGPPFIKLSKRTIRYLRGDLYRWLNAHRVEPPKAPESADG